MLSTMIDLVKTSMFAMLLMGGATGASAQSAEDDVLTNGQGEMAGEVTATDVLLQSRLTQGRALVDGDLPGHPGVARFEISTSEDFSASFTTPWSEATPDVDYLIKEKVGGLEPDVRYYYRLEYGVDTSRTQKGRTGTFRTLAGRAGTDPVSFVAANCMNYARHYGGRDDLHRKYWPPYQAADSALGYPALEAIRELEPDFFIGAGDNVYYDYGLPGQEIATTREGLRQRWHEQFAQPRMADLFARVPTYWIKDDHDFRFNDADTTGSRPPSPALGIATFREQVPVVDLADPDAVTYRTHRLNRHVQIWLIEGRDYRSPNTMSDGPEKSIWGDRQEAWLKETLLESDATFKFIIHPTPMVGPDGAGKGDNHTNPGGFQYERDTFFGWLRENGFIDQDLYLIVGDRHWQYHAVHPVGIEEFSVGALVDGNARYGVEAGARGSTDPMGLIRQPYLQAPPSGGFLHVRVEEARDSVQAAFTFYNEHGDTLHTTTKQADRAAPHQAPPINLVPVWTRIGDDEGRIDQDNETASVESAEFSPDGELIVSASKGRRGKDGRRKGQAVKLWRTERGVEVWLRPRADEVEAVAFSPDGQHVAAGGEDGLVEILQVREGGELLLEPQLVATLRHEAAIDGLRFSRDGRLLATGDENTDLHLYRTSDWERLAQVNNGGTEPWMAVNQMDFTSDDRHLVAAVSNGDVRIWEVQAEEGGDGTVQAAELNLVRILEEHGGSIKSVRISPDNRFIAAGASEENGVRVWDLEGNLVKEIPATGGAMETLAWTSDGAYLFTGGTEGKEGNGIGAIRAYDASDDFALVMIEPVFRQEYLHFSTDGRLLVSSHEDGTLRLWDVERR